MPGVPNGTVGCSGCCHHQDPEMSLLLEAREQLRASEEAQRLAAETQAAILNALPAHVALIGPDGVILTVNESWRRSAAASALIGLDAGVGQNYLDACDRASGDCYEEAQAAAIGIRRVLQGEARDFSLEYPCHSATERQWFHFTVTPLRQDRRAGAVVMHVEITQRKRAEQAAQRSQKRLHDLIDGLGPSMFVGLMTPQGIMLEANRPALAAAGLKPEDVLGKPFEETYWWAYTHLAGERDREAQHVPFHGVVRPSARVGGRGNGQGRADDASPGHAGPGRGRQRDQPADPREVTRTVAHEARAG